MIAKTALLLTSVGLAQGAHALELDWSGQFRAEFNYIHNYAADSTDAALSYDAARGGAGGYYIPAGGKRDATFETVFLKLKPKLIVNDNIYIKSEWWVGNPAFAIFGNGVPYSTEQRQFFSTQNRGSVITAQRFWGEFLSDIGTVQVGRAPLHWGLGVVWNNGDGLWDRFQSTGDTIRLVSKFGAFSFVPSFVLYSAGNNVGGACLWDPTTQTCGPAIGSGGVSELTLALKYENADEDFEGGVQFIRRLSGSAQDPTGGGYLGPSGTPISANYNVWDLYAKKRFGKFTIAAEAPIVTGNIGTNTNASMSYSTFAVATEAGFKFNDTWEVNLRAGHAPGQPSFTGANPETYKAFYFNPAYRLGFIMFNYQLANFAGPNTQNNENIPESQLKSPYYNPIVNANYGALTALLHTDKWTFSTAFVYAQAVEAAVANQRFLNTNSGLFSAGNAVQDQGKSLGFEVDLGATFQWDDYFQFGLDLGVWLPGSYWKFSNTAVENQTSAVYAGTARIGINF